MSGPPLISLTHVTKTFGGVAALADVSLDVLPGTVHAFIGENGAGKSTLGKIISGTHEPDSGTMAVAGHDVSFRNPRDALGQGIATIQQEIALVPHRSVMENVFLGREASFAGFVDNRRLRAEYAELTDTTGFHIPADTVVSSLRVADQQKVEILRAIARKAKLIVFDEPTAALTPDETEVLLSLIQRLRADGVAVIYVSHFLDEVLAIADEITILRGGKLVRTTSARTETPASLIASMLGRDQESVFPPRRQRAADGPDVLRVENLSRRKVLHDISFSVRRGEILGVAGLVGSGRSELLRAIFGADQIDSGTIQLREDAHATFTLPKAIKAGIAMIPESRKDQGLFLSRTVAENMTLGCLDEISRAGLISRRRETRLVDEYLETLDVHPADPDFTIGLMSGGNQQKLLLAKWLVRNPTLLLIDEPTRGVDVGARYSIYEHLFKLADQGMTLIIVSSEVEEVLGLCDRVLVMRRGRIVLDAARADVDQDIVMHAAFGSGDPSSEEPSLTGSSN